MARFLIVALEGDLTPDLDAIVRACGWKPTGQAQFFTSWEAVAPYLGEEGVVVAGHAGQWTILSDDRVLTGAVFNDLNRGDSLAKQFKTRVVSALGEDTGCEYGFRVHSPNGLRAVMVREEVEQNIGEPIPGEPPVEVNEYNEESVLEVLQLLGIDIEEGLEACDKAAVIRFA